MAPDFELSSIGSLQKVHGAGRCVNGEVAMKKGGKQKNRLPRKTVFIRDTDYP
jgi:hypothetical protein